MTTSPSRKAFAGSERCGPDDAARRDTVRGFTQLISETALASPRLGAPGVYLASAAPADELTPEAMDVAAFVGVAPRGPAWEVTTDPDVDEGQPFRARSVAVPVASWDDYVDLFGGFEGPGLLPHAVSAYFAQGGLLAYVVRVVPWQCNRPEPAEPPPGCAILRIGAASSVTGAGQARGPWLRVAARNEGTWGDRLSVVVTFTRRRLTEIPHAATDAQELRLPAAALITPGATLAFTAPSVDRRLAGARAAPTAPRYGMVKRLRRHPHDTDPGFDLVAEMDMPPIDFVPAMTVDVVEADLVVSDADPARPRVERLRAVGLAECHPRWISKVIATESLLIQPATIDAAELRLALSGGRAKSELERHGEDLWDSIVPEDVFPVRGESRCERSDGSKPACGSEPWNEAASHAGVGAITLVEDVASIVVPDLYAPTALTPKVPAASAEHRPPVFARCAPQPPPVAPPPPPPKGLRLDPSDRADRARIVALQQTLVASAEAMQRIALLDVPPGLTIAQLLAWRASFDSAFAAAYHPWLRMPAPLNQVHVVPPSATAAGIIARSERVRGIARGPANEVGVGIVDIESVVSPDDHAALHRLGVNVFLPDADGIRLTGARTMSGDSHWRQLTVRRLLLSIERAVRRRLQWAVFEPNDDRLRDALRRQLDSMLHALFEQGCFAGSTPEESWFVHLAARDEARAETEAGQVIVEIGVAPSEPLEFIVIVVSLRAEGDIKSAVRTGAGVGVDA
jgi:hypothetical protein